MTDKKSVQDTPIVSHDRTTETIRTQLHLAVVVERRFTVQQIAENSGVGKDAVASYMRNDGPKEPSLSRALSIAVVLGPRAVNSIMSIIGYGAHLLDEPPGLNVNCIVAEGLRQFTTIAAAASDGRIDHTEAPACQEAADMLIATVLPLSSAGRAA